MPGLRVVGIDCHIGSQITQEAPYMDAMDRMLDLVQAIEAAGIVLDHLDFGGGLGINYNGDSHRRQTSCGPSCWRKLDARGFGKRTVMLEPGRSLVGNAGLCVTEVLYLKPGDQKNFCIVDAAMNDLPRPAMYQAFHAIVPVQKRSGEAPPPGMWWARCAKVATGSATTGHWPCKAATCWPSCPQGPIA
jgi:diaminopimelate decarboxylase